MTNDSDIDSKVHDDRDDGTSALLDQLGALAREQLASREAEWEDFARGELSEQELRDVVDEDADSFARSLDLFRPLDELERERLTRALLAGGSRGADTEPTTVTTLPSSSPSKRSRWRRLATAALPLAAAAALVLWIGQRPPTGAETGAQLELPGYQIEVRGGVKSERSTHAPTQVEHRYTPSSEFEVVLRPATDTRGPIGARVFAFPTDAAGAPVTGSKGQMVPVTMQASESGSFRVSGPTHEILPLPAGHWRLVFVVGHRDQLPDDPARVRPLAAHAAHDGLWVEEYSVELLAPERG